jgi:hypothetical protein
VGQGDKVHSKQTNQASLKNFVWTIRFTEVVENKLISQHKELKNSRQV